MVKANGTRVSEIIVCICSMWSMDLFVLCDIWICLFYVSIEFICCMLSLDLFVLCEHLVLFGVCDLWICLFYMIFGSVVCEHCIC